MSYNLGQIDPDERTGLYVDPRDEEPAAPPRRVLTDPGRAVGHGRVCRRVVVCLFRGRAAYGREQRQRRHSADPRRCAADQGQAGRARRDACSRPEHADLRRRPGPTGGASICCRRRSSRWRSRSRRRRVRPPHLRRKPRRRRRCRPRRRDGRTDAVASPATPRPGQSSVPSAEPRPRPAQPRPARPRPEQAGGLRLQLGAVRSAGMARAEWDRLKRTNPDLLGHLTAVAVRADVGDRGVYYRIQTGPIADSQSPSGCAASCGSGIWDA